jgi:dipeptidyl aminopeptidase/acylaminoacyl peptidase
MRRGILISSAALALGLFLPSIARTGTAEGPERPITPAEAIEWNRPSQLDLAPDGSRALFRVVRFDLEANRSESAIWIVSTDGSGARRLTYADAVHSRPRWAPDGQSFAFLSDRGERSQIWQMAADGGEASPLTDHTGAIGNFAWSPDGSTIAFTAATDGEDGGISDSWVYGEPRGRAALWLLERASGSTRQLTPEELSVEEIAWSPDGGQIAVIARPTTVLDEIGDREIYLVETAEQVGVRRLTENRAVESGLEWTADGAGLLFTAPDAERFINAENKLFRLDPETGEVVRLAAGFETGISSVSAEPDGGVRFLSGVGVTQGVYGLPPTAIRNPEADSVPGGISTLATEGTVSEYDIESGRLATIWSNARQLPEVYVENLRVSEAPVRLTDLNPEAGAWALGETRVERWASDDGWQIEGLLTLPVGYREGARVPLLVMIHGGPEAAHTIELAPNYIEAPQLWAGRGWAVLRVNYRGGTNYGDTFLQGMNGDTGGGDYRDIISGVDHAIERGIADPDRLAVMGWSWGGISTGWIVTQTDRFAAASAGAMVSNHLSVFGQADLTFDVRQFYIGGSPWEDPARYIKMSPIGHVQSARTPTLLVHGQADERCPLPQSVEFYKALESVGVETELVIYPREPHVFREPKHMLDKIERELAWFGRHVLER